MIRKFRQDDEAAFISMANEFYSSRAVLHRIPEEYIHNTFNEAVSSSPYAQAYIIEEENERAGYGLISLTYSSEVGGLTVLIEELYIRDKFRGRGLGNNFLDFIHGTFAGRAKRFRLELTKTNGSAQRLYLRKGYRPIEYQQMVRDQQE